VVVSVLTCFSLSELPLDECMHKLSVYSMGFAWVSISLCVQYQWAFCLGEHKSGPDQELLLHT